MHQRIIKYLYEKKKSTNIPLRYVEPGSNIVEDLEGGTLHLRPPRLPRPLRVHHIGAPRVCRHHDVMPPQRHANPPAGSHTKRNFFFSAGEILLQDHNVEWDIQRNLF